MNVRPVFFRSPDDDGAPLDYSYVPSVSEGRRRQQEQAIHQKDSPSTPIVRHRAAPLRRDAVDIYGTAGPKNARGAGGLHPPYRDEKAALRSGRPRACAKASPIPKIMPSPITRSTRLRKRPGRPGAPAVPSRLSNRRGCRAARIGRNLSGRASRGACRNHGECPRHGRAHRSARRFARHGDGGTAHATSLRPVRTCPNGLRVAQQNNLPLRRPEGRRVQAAPPSQEAPAPTDLLGRPPAPPHARAAPPLRPASPDHGGLRAGGLSPSAASGAAAAGTPAGRAARAPAARRAVCREPATRSRQKRERSSARFTPVLSAGPCPMGTARGPFLRAHTGDGAAPRPRRTGRRPMPPPPGLSPRIPIR